MFLFVYVIFAVFPPAISFAVSMASYSFCKSITILFFFDWLSLPKAKRIAKSLFGDSSICYFSTENWWKTYCKCKTELPENEWNHLLDIIHNNDFNNVVLDDYSGIAMDLLSFYVDNRKAKMEIGSDLYKMKVEYEKQPIQEAKRKHVFGREETKD